MSDNLERLRAALGDRYRIERELGEGGMATVYLAEDLRHQRRVALKVLRPEPAATMGPERFLQEVRVTANLRHPHILPLFDSGEADGFLYYVMPYLDGESLRERVQREGELPVAEAVSEATGRHQLTTMGVALGTPAYMAPEQAAADEHVDHRADIYAVGAMAYELLSGRPPFSGMTSQQVLSAHVTEEPRPVTEHRRSVPPELGAVIMRCLAKKPADRWQSAEELLGQLELLATPTTGITPTQSLPAEEKTTTGTPLWMKVAAPLALAVIALGVWLGVREPAVPGGEGSEGAVATAAVEGPTYVVAPFENQSGVDSLDAFGSVVATYLTSQISRNDIARVAPSSAVKSLADGLEPGADPVAHYAGATGARYVVTGSYFAQGGVLVVQAEVAAADGSELVPVGPIEAPMSTPALGWWDL